MLDDAPLGHSPLPRGITGFRGAGEPPLPSTDRAAILGALHAAARAERLRVGTASHPHSDPGRNYWEVPVTGTGVDGLALVVNDVHPFAAFATPTMHRPNGLEFVDQPSLAERLSGHLVVLPTIELARTVSQADLEALADAELKEIRYWRPSTFGEIIFNTWD